MAIRRMFAKSITDSDDFLDLPLDVQLLYFHLGMQADDEGFLNSTRKIVRMLGVEPDALQILCDMGFLIPFPSGVLPSKGEETRSVASQKEFSTNPQPPEVASLGEKKEGFFDFEFQRKKEEALRRLRNY